MEYITVAKNLFIAAPLTGNKGYTWTLASVVGKMLDLAEDLFGPRDTSFTFLGVEFLNGDPHTWFPNNNKRIVIQLGESCLREPDRACFQLAHEVVHLLSPVKKNEASVLEEGIATSFQMRFMREHYGSIGWGVSSINLTLPSYGKAKEAAEELLSADSDSIKKLRRTQPVISYITSKLICEQYPSFDKSIAEQLEAKFQRNNT